MERITRTSCSVYDIPGCFHTVLEPQGFSRLDIPATPETWMRATFNAVRHFWGANDPVGVAFEAEWVATFLTHPPIAGASF